jgi:hypothetical protein
MPLTVLYPTNVWKHLCRGEHWEFGEGTKYAGGDFVTAEGNRFPTVYTEQQLLGYGCTPVNNQPPVVDSCL